MSAMDPEVPIGPWIFYIVFACIFHAGIQSVLALISVVWQSAQRALMTLGTAVAICSAAGFLASLAWGAEPDLEHAALIALRLALGAAVAGPLLWVWSLLRSPGLYLELGMPTWVALTNLGGCTVFTILVVTSRVALPPPLESIAGMVMLGALIMYWSPVFLLPWRYLTRMDHTGLFPHVL